MRPPPPSAQEPGPDLRLLDRVSAAALDAVGVLAGQGGELELTHFMQRLALALTTSHATTFLLGEYAEGEHDSGGGTYAH